MKEMSFKSGVKCRGMIGDKSEGGDCDAVIDVG